MASTCTMLKLNYITYALIIKLFSKVNSQIFLTFVTGRLGLNLLT
jgi:hypothetical protein